MKNVERHHYAEQLAAQCRLRYATTNKRVRLKTDRVPIINKTAQRRYHALAQEYERLIAAAPRPLPPYFAAALMKRILLREWGYYLDNHHRAYIVAAVERIRSGVEPDDTCDE